MDNSTSILLVDDSKSTLAYMREVLEKIGHSVVVAQNGREALELFECQETDIVITDLQMPEMDGFELITLLKESHPNTPIIIISGLVNPDDIIEAHRLGAWDYLLKPFKNSFEVEIAVKRVLERSRILGENRRYHEHLQELVHVYTQDVRESKSRYKRLLESLTSYVYTVTFAKDGSINTIHRPGCETVTGYTSEEYRIDHNLWYRVVHDNDQEKVLEVVERIMNESGPQQIEHRICHKDGSIRWVCNTLVPCRVSGALLSYDGIISDITERKEAEERLRESEERYRIVTEQIGQLVYVFDTNRKKIGCNGDVKRVTGYGADEFQAMSITQRKELIHPDDRHMAVEILRQALRDKTSYSVEYRVRKKDGSYVYINDHGIALAGQDGDGCRMLGMMEDISVRKNAEEALMASEAKHRLQFESMPIGCVVFDPQFRITLWNPAAERIFGFSAAEVLGRDPLDIIVPKDVHSHVTGVLQSLFEGETVTLSDNANLTKDGRLIFCSWTNNQMLAPDGSVSGILSMCQDITERRLSEEQLKHHMSNLEALSTIDAAINSSLDLRITLKVLLQETLKQLKVDASCVLLLDSYSQMLEYKAGMGFSTNRISLARVRLGDSYAGRVAKERKSLIISDINTNGNEPAPIGLIASEGFQAYVGVPLVAKGQVKGVLEIFHRGPLNPDQGWLGFVETFANQAAIALDNAEMYDSLQSSHSELLLAYDTTIEGWSRALDFRDKETEGHSKRVTDLTVRIAREMGLGKEKLIHIRRGALLHDIGKLGVPDSILLKPGKLTGEEFEIMKQHTKIAFSILSPIEFLRPAIEIPHYHHEKWDGSGYPHGLKGEEIPLAARIFAYVDVWDALLSDRPYRLAWPLEKVRQHIRAQAGTHFDPNMMGVIEEIVLSDENLWPVRF